MPVRIIGDVKRVITTSALNELVNDWRLCLDWVLFVNSTGRVGVRCAGICSPLTSWCLNLCTVLFFFSEGIALHNFPVLSLVNYSFNFSRDTVSVQFGRPSYWIWIHLFQDHYWGWTRVHSVCSSFSEVSIFLQVVSRRSRLCPGSQTRAWIRSLRRRKRAPSLRSCLGPRAQMRLCCRLLGAAARGTRAPPTANSPTWPTEAPSCQTDEFTVQTIHFKTCALCHRCLQFESYLPPKPFVIPRVPPLILADNSPKVEWNTTDY